MALSRSKHERPHYDRPHGLLAGFIATAPESAVSELVHIGEQWAPSTFFIPDHAHDVWEFYMQIGGESRWDAENETYTLKAGDFFAVAPHVPHQMHERAKARHHFFFAAIDLKAVFARHQALGALWENRSVAFFSRAESLMTPFRQLVREVSLLSPQRETGIRLSLDYLVVEASRLCDSRTQSASLVLGHPAVARAKDLLERQPNRPWTLLDLSRTTGLSPSHLADRFSREIGLPPHRYLLQVRLERARELLRDCDISIRDLALELGFSSSQHFAAAFKRATGKTAGEYRRGDLEREKS